MAEKEHRAQDYAEGGLNLKINFRKLKYYGKILLPRNFCLEIYSIISEKIGEAFLNGR